MNNSIKYYWCSIGFTFSALFVLIANYEWLSILFLILSSIAILFGHLVENGDFK